MRIPHEGLLIFTNLHFSIYFFIAEGKKVKRMVRSDVFGDGVGRFMDFPSVRP